MFWQMSQENKKKTILVWEIELFIKYDPKSFWKYIGELGIKAVKS